MYCAATSKFWQLSVIPSGLWWHLASIILHYLVCTIAVRTWFVPRGSLYTSLFCGLVVCQHVDSPQPSSSHSGFILGQLWPVTMQFEDQSLFATAFSTDTVRLFFTSQEDDIHSRLWSGLIAPAAEGHTHTTAGNSSTTKYAWSCLAVEEGKRKQRPRAWGIKGLKAMEAQWGLGGVNTSTLSSDLIKR